MLRVWQRAPRFSLLVPRRLYSGENSGSNKKLNIKEILQTTWGKVTAVAVVVGAVALPWAPTIAPFFHNSASGVAVEKYKEQHLEALKREQEDKMKAALKNGYCPAPEKKKHWIERKEELETLYPVMNPPSLENYLLITGENGCGKTSLVQEAIQKNKSGVIYIDSKNFDADMATALNYKPINDQPMPHGIQWIPFFEKCAVDFSKNNGGKKATLVIDNINLLTKPGKNVLLEDLQNEAKAAADSGKYRVVFVSSEGSGTEFLKKFSAKSRMRIYVISDLTKVEAKKLLINFPEEQGGFIYDNITGGRLQLLRKFFETDPQTVISEVARETNEKIRDLCVSAPSKLVHAIGFELLKGQVSEEMIQDAIKSAPTLLASNVFSPDAVNKYQVRFQSAAVATYFRCQSEGKKFAPDFRKLIACN